MKLLKARIIFLTVAFFIINTSACFAIASATLHSTDIHPRNLADNIFASSHSFSANGFITSTIENVNHVNKLPYNDVKPYKIEASFNNIMLDNCNYTILDEQTVARLFRIESKNNEKIIGWSVNCNIPSFLTDGIYTTKIDIKFEDGNSISIFKENIQYNGGIQFITPQRSLLIIFLIILFCCIQIPLLYKKIIISLLGIFITFSCITKNIYPFYGYLFWMFFVTILYCLRPQSIIHHITFKHLNYKHIFFIFIFLIITINIYMIPISLSPFHTSPLTHNGSLFNTNEQYDALAQQIIKGKLYIDYGKIDEKLTSMENPYDYSKRIENNVDFPLDHSYYKGKFYMYFGVVPVFILFIPYQLIVGEPLHSYYATKIFVILSIIGIFSLFYLFTRQMFVKITLGMYLTLSAAFAMMATWCCVDAPALYCTAVSSGICLEIWSIYFFVRYFLLPMSIKQKIINIFIGSLLGALVFGCRPPIGLANILFISVLFHFVTHNGVKKIKYIVFFTSPYFVIISLLMLYNYLRFDNPLEFGLSYLLTIEDLHNYKNYMQEKFNFNILFTKLYTYLFRINSLSDTFPFINFNGIFINFPILFTLFLFLNKNIFKYFSEFNIRFFIFILLFVPFIIATFNCIAVNDIIERYRMDIYFSIIISCYLAIGASMMISRSPQTISCLTTIAAFMTIFYNVILMFVPQQGNFTYFFPEINQRFFHILTFGLGG